MKKSRFMVMLFATLSFFSLSAFASSSDNCVNLKVVNNNQEVLVDKCIYESSDIANMEYSSNLNDSYVTKIETNLQTGEKDRVVEDVFSHISFSLEKDNQGNGIEFTYTDNELYEMGSYEGISLPKFNVYNVKGIAGFKQSLNFL